MSSPVSPGSTTSLLASLPARPPTPPRDPHVSAAATGDDDTGKAVSDALRFLERGHDEPDMVTKTTNVTKPTTTTTDGNATNSTHGAIDTPPPKTAPRTEGSTAKKVVFSPLPTYHEIPAHGTFDSAVPLPHATARPSNLGQSPMRPLKPILKAPADPMPTPDEVSNALDPLAAQEPQGFRQMLNSVLLQLEGPSRDARRDAYMALTGAIRTYTRVPDPQSLTEKMARLTPCLSRDLAWKDPAGGWDAQIVSQALALTTAILFDPQTAGLLDLDFQANVIERSISVLEQEDMSRVIVKGTLHLLCVQRFSRAVFGAAGRADRLISVLQNLEARNSMIAARLVIYQRLIERAPTAMLNRIQDWIEHIFHALLSSVHDIQRRAIDVCTQMGMLLGHHPQTAKAISELCEREIEDGQCYGDYLNVQLMQMTSDREKAPLVPEIWAAVVLCFRTKRCPIGKWPKFRQWLLTIQKCLNASDMAVKRPANTAWNRLVYTVMPDSSTSELLRSMLKVPILAGLERRGNSELSQQLRQLSLESYCNLLHYAMRPELCHEELDLAWDMYVGPVLTKISKTGTKGRSTALRVLHGLLKKTGGIWNASAANEQVPIQPVDLPRLDARWVRSRMARFIAVMEPIILAGVSMAPETQRATENCWRSLIAAVAEAGSQEVKASNELKDAVTVVIQFFRRLPSDTGLMSEHEGVSWLKRYQNMLEVAVEINELWSQLLSLVMEKLQSMNSHMLEILEPLLLAGFSSPSKTIVNTTIGFWNSSFAREQQLDYPVKLLPVLHARQIQSDLILPVFAQKPIELVAVSEVAKSQAPTIVDRRALTTSARASKRPQQQSPDNIFIKQHLAAQQTHAPAPCSSSTSRPRTDDSQVHFAPVEPTTSTAHSQVLTERQQEVRDRQRVHAQAYPELSSSPSVRSSKSRELTPKKLSFVSDLRRTETGDIVITPKGAKEGIQFSDDLPSSPTPHAKEAGVPSITDSAVDDDENSEQLSLPSSPPRSPTEEAPASSVLETVTSMADGPTSGDAAVDGIIDVNMDMAVDDADLPSDTQLPNVQLQVEEEASLAYDSASRMTDATETPRPGREILHKIPATPSRIDETVLPLQDSILSTPSDAGTADSRISRSSRKRKRTADTAHIARKRKATSPFNKFMSYFNNHGQEDDIEEEIVVSMTREPESSPVNTTVVQDTPMDAEEAVTASSQASLLKPIVKRKPGRPKKSSSQNTPPTSTPSRARKRPASALSTEEADSPGARLNDDTVFMSMDSGSASKPLSQKQRSESDRAVDAQVDEQAEVQNVSQDRPIAQSQSILGRLRGILADCKNLILGSQEEEREFDDVLFEIRRKVHQGAQY